MEGSDGVRIISRTGSLRCWIDSENTGHIRIIRRVTLPILIGEIRDLVILQRRENLPLLLIRIYLPPSLKAEISTNLLSFIDFSDHCCNLSILICDSAELI